MNTESISIKNICQERQMSNIQPNLTENQPWPSQATLVVAHGQICDEFGRLENLRSSLLTSIPGVTVLLSGASIFLGDKSTPTVQHFISVLGVLGMFSILGLYYREVEYEMENVSLVHQLNIYERILQIPNTLYISSPRMTHKVLKKEYATILLYGSSFTAWFCVATWFVLPAPSAIIIAPFVLLGILLVQLQLRNSKISSLPQLQAI
jgi:hypothetical protein